MSHKQQAYTLIDQLGPSQLAALVQFLEAMVNEEDDVLTEDDRQAVIASREYFQQGNEGISFEQVVAECGFTMDQITATKSK